MTRPGNALCRELVALLVSSSGRGEGTPSVEIQATADAWLLWTDRFVYKMLRPAGQSECDARTLSERRHACELEVRLNRRLAPDVYLEALPVMRDASGAVRLGEGQSVEDWVIKMRRLPADRSLSHLIATGAVTSNDVANVARVIGEFYASRPPLCVRPDGYRSCLARRVDEHLQKLAGVGDATWRRDVRRVHAALRRFLALLPDVLDRRVCDGRIVDGHGDLRPEHIFVESPPAVVGCVVQNDHLRQLDMADEWALLSVECDRMGGGWVGQQVTRACCQTTCDDVPRVLVDFYKGYRAAVRAKAVVGQTTAGPATPGNETNDRAAGYLTLARGYLEQLGSPLLVVVGGLMGTGKSTLAASLGEQLAIDDLHTDQIRRQLLGAADDPAAYERDDYQSQLRDQVYEELLRNTEQLLRAGDSAVVDGTFLTHRWRQRAAELARRYGALPLFVACECSRSMALTRLDRRTDASYKAPEARPGFYDCQTRVEDPWDEQLPVVHLDTTLALNRQLECVTMRLREELVAIKMLAAPDCS